MTWLIVEDDPEIRNLVAVMMQVWGETPMALPDGNAAWNWLDTVNAGTYKGDLPELALMDIRMPGHTGDQIAARMRTTERLKHIPIILMTAFTLTDVEVQGMVDSAGIDRLVKKPFDMDDFRATLYRVRDEKRKRNAEAVAAASPTAANPSAPAAPVSVPVSITVQQGTAPTNPPRTQTAILNPPSTAPAATVKSAEPAKPPSSPSTT